MELTINKTRYEVSATGLTHVPYRLVGPRGSLVSVLRRGSALVAVAGKNARTVAVLTDRNGTLEVA